MNKLPTRRCLSSVLRAALGFVLVPAPVVQAQDAVAVDSLRRIQSVVPLHGPPGTRVDVFTENLPLQARIHVGVGAIGTGFEVLGEGAQGEWGAISASVRIPASATWDKPLVLIIFNAIFSPIAISEPFHVTNSEGVVRRLGHAVAREDGSFGGECSSFRDLDGYLYTLRGRLDDVGAGEEIAIEGRVADAGLCKGGNTIDVIRIERARDDPTAAELGVEEGGTWKGASRE